MPERRLFRTLLDLISFTSGNRRPILLSLTAFASGPVRDVVYQGDLHPLNIVPTFDNGYLAAYDRGGIAVYAPGGAPALHLPNPGNGIVWKVAVDTDGTVAMAESWQGDSEGGSLSLVLPERRSC